MNHAFVDASWHETGLEHSPNGKLPGTRERQHERQHERQDGVIGVGGWGLVLLRPGLLPARFQGQLYAPDNNAAELRAVLEAVYVAPENETLTVHTDNQAVITSVGKGRGPTLLSEATQEVLEVAAQRQVTLRVRYAPRTRRHMLSAHNLANDARKGVGTPGLDSAQTDVLIEHKAAWEEAKVSLRRSTERITAHVPLDPLSDVPPSAQALLAAVSLAQPGEVLIVRRASKIAQALWQRPERALRPTAQGLLQTARQTAHEQGIQVQFLGVG